MKPFNVIHLEQEQQQKKQKLPWAKLSFWTREYIAFFSNSSDTVTRDLLGAGHAQSEFICCINLMEKIGGLSHKFA